MGRGFSPIDDFVATGIMNTGNERKTFLKRFRLLLLVLVVVLTIVVVQALQIFYGANDFEGVPQKTFFVSKGDTFASIVDSLEARGIIRSRELFVFAAKFYGGTEKIHVGKYVFDSGISNVDLFLALREGDGAKLISVRLPEGSRSKTQAAILAHTIGIDSARYDDLAHDKSFIHSLGIDAPSLEGYLLPETYSFYWQPNEEYVIRRLVDQFRLFYDDSLRARAEELGWTTNQVVTLASIVEGEVVLDEERATISGVYHNRLRRRMRLEADPTIQFIIEDGPRRVLYSDLKIDHPYNTYRNKGLPPGPVNNPGKASILAALFPAKHKYLFFVANGDGGHWFSTNYSGHLRNVRKYRKNRTLRTLQALSQTESSRDTKSD